tara:strand:+ start:292 stop:615 length:324 start_codon:yes stop_codon:yes gene_type:complete
MPNKRYTFEDVCFEAYFRLKSIHFVADSLTEATELLKQHLVTPEEIKLVEEAQPNTNAFQAASISLTDYEIEGPERHRLLIDHTECVDAHEWEFQEFEELSEELSNE